MTIAFTFQWIDGRCRLANVILTMEEKMVCGTSGANPNATTKVQWLPRENQSVELENSMIAKAIYATINAIRNCSKQGSLYVFGLRELLIPLPMYLAARQSLVDVAMVVLVFSVSPIGTLCSVVGLCALGIERLPMH